MVILKSKNTETIIKEKPSDYIRYMNSSSWKNKSKQYIKNAKKCQRCGFSFDLTCHHTNYDNLGNETYKDIIVLCWTCHKKFHRNLKGKRFHMSRYFENMSEPEKEILGHIYKGEI